VYGTQSTDEYANSHIKLMLTSDLTEGSRPKILFPGSISLKLRPHYVSYI